MSGEEKLKAELEIRIEPAFFYEKVLPDLTKRGYEHTQMEGLDGVILRSLSGPDGAVTFTAAMSLLVSLMKERLITRYILTNSLDFRHLYRIEKEIRVKDALSVVEKSSGYRVYEDCARIGDAGLGGSILLMAKDRFPFMAYHCALDGLTVTHVSQAFFREYSHAGDALAMFSYVHGVGSVYVCIADRTERREEAAGGKESGKVDRQGYLA